MRKAKIERNTNETQISLELNLDGTGVSSIQTGIGFFDHMLTLWSKHSGIDLTLTANGDLEVDQHHTVEDVGIVLGQALNEALGERRGIGRYGAMTLPMDEVLATVAVDLGGRPYCVLNTDFPSPKIGEFDAELVADFFEAIAGAARSNIHVLVHYGRNGHHQAEAIFKAFARATRQAVARVGNDDIPSTKGTLS